MICDGKSVESGETGESGESDLVLLESQAGQRIPWALSSVGSPFVVGNRLEINSSPRKNRTPTGAKGARRVYKYSQLPRMGFPEDVCQHCMDNSVLVEQY